MWNFLDLSKAFDCVVHEILYKKLSTNGITGICLEWVKSYLSDRYQITEICNTDKYGKPVKKQSGKKPLKYGVPQGSILGPILFLIYINDLPDFCLDNGVKPTIYADDSNVHVSALDNKELVEKISATIIILEKWFSINGLVMNRTKTEILSF